MRYDFKEIQRKINRAGLTLKEVEQMTIASGERVECSTIGRALRTGRAAKSTARIFSRVFDVPMDAMLPPEKPRRKTA